MGKMGLHLVLHLSESMCESVCLEEMCRRASGLMYHISKPEGKRKRWLTLGKR